MQKIIVFLLSFSFPLIGMDWTTPIGQQILKKSPKYRKYEFDSKVYHIVLKKQKTHKCSKDNHPRGYSEWVLGFNPYADNTSIDHRDKLPSLVPHKNPDVKLTHEKPFVKDRANTNKPEKSTFRQLARKVAMQQKLYFKRLGLKHSPVEIICASDSDSHSDSDSENSNSEKEVNANESAVDDFFPKSRCSGYFPKPKERTVNLESLEKKKENQKDSEEKVKNNFGGVLPSRRSGTGFSKYFT